VSWHCNFFRIKIISLVFQWISNLTLFHLISCCFLGMKGVAKAMKEISSGAQKWEGEKWYSELSDKCMYCNLSFPSQQNSIFRYNPSGVVRYIEMHHCYWISQYFLEASVKRHFYSMKNCTSPDDLRRRLPTVVDHYQVQHSTTWSGLKRSRKLIDISYWNVSKDFWE